MEDAFDLGCGRGAEGLHEIQCMLVCRALPIAFGGGQHVVERQGERGFAVGAGGALWWLDLGVGSVAHAAIRAVVGTPQSASTSATSVTLLHTATGTPAFVRRSWASF